MRFPLFPSDLDESGPHGELALSGRVVLVGDTGFRIGDAFGTVEIRGMADVTVGDLVTLSVQRDSNGIELLAVIECQRPVRAAGAETKRFASERIAANVRARAAIFAVLRSYFEREHFVEVDTPLLVRSPGLDLHLDAVEVEGGYLITSPEYQMKRMLAGGFPRIFQISHVFRRGEVGSRHNPEFTMLEWYRAFATVAEVMRDTELLIAEVATIAEAGPPALHGEHGRIDVTPPFPRMTVAEAFQRFAGISMDRMLTLAESSPDSYFHILVDQIEPALAQLPTPVFLTDFPISQASLARAKPDDPRLCERFELYAGGVELCNGFGELTDPGEQRRRLLADQAARTQIGKPVYPIDERFLAALEEGMPASAGNALGVDRLVALALGEPEIARVMPFPASHV
jgi:lysyl-tRNA synthetase class 2